MNEVLSIIKSLSVGRLCNFILTGFSAFLSRLFRIPVLLNQPWAASVEPSAVCQLSCPECPVGLNEISRKNNFLSNENFSAILNGLSKKTFWLNLYFQGEPLLDDDLAEKIKMARARRMFVVLSTNALALDKNMAARLCNAGTSKIIISLDGADEDTYLKYRSGGDFRKVLGAISNLHEARKNKKSPLIEVQMLVFSYNEKQKDDLRKMALNLGADKVVFKSPQFYDVENAAKNLSSEKKYQRYHKNSEGKVQLKTKNKRFCKRLWNTIVINSDGNVVACCYDKFSKYQMGNAVENAAADIWKNAEFMQFRRDFLQGKRKDICTNCE
ncbi:Coenzyme PQQ synthesis protein E [anaerobic digester metagenome]